EPVRVTRPDRRRPAHADRGREREEEPPRYQARDLRRTRRRPREREVLPPSRIKLRQLQSLPRPHCTISGRPGRPRCKLVEQSLASFTADSEMTLLESPA